MNAIFSIECKKILYTRLLSMISTIFVYLMNVNIFK